MRIAICENEISHKENVQNLLRKWAKMNNREISIAAFNDAESILSPLEDVGFDVLLLDIEMKKISGMELAKLIRRTNDDAIIIFITSHTSYSLEGYDVNPLHYLIKPLNEKVFFKVLDKAYAIYSIRGGDALVINTEDGSTRVPTEAIRYISMNAHYAKIYTHKGVYETRITAKELTACLPSHFIECHRSYIINMFKVSCTFRDYVVMDDETKIKMSKPRSKQVRELFARLQTR